MHLPPPFAIFRLARRIHLDAALQVSLARLVMLVEVHRARRRGNVSTIRRYQVEAVQSVQPYCRSIVAKQNLRVPRCRFPAPVIGGGGMKPAQMRGSLKLRVFGVNDHRLPAAHCVQFHRPIQHQEALLRVVGSAHGAAASLHHGKIHVLAGRRDSTLCVEEQSAGLHVDFATLGGLRR